MSNVNNTFYNITSTVSSVSVNTLSRPLKFWLYLVFLIPSIICTLFVLYHLLFDRTLRHAFNNYIIIIILFVGLIVEITDIPWMLDFYRFSIVREKTLAYCLIWTFIDFTYFVMQNMLFAWASIERHILIFNSQWIVTKKNQILIHYLPPIIIILYFHLYYGVFIFFSSCQNVFDYTVFNCFTPCYLKNRIASLWGTIVHNILPIIIIAFFNIALLIRVIWQKYRVHQSIQWKKYRKMAIQLLSNSLLYLFFAFPYMVLKLLTLCGVPSSALATYSPYTTFFLYYVILLFPFVCVVSLSELRTKITKLFFWRQQRRVVSVRPLDAAHMKQIQMPVVPAVVH